MEQRRFQESDIEKILEFKKKSVQVSFPDNNFNPEKYKESVLKNFEREPEGMHVLEENGKVIGFLWMSTTRTILGKCGLVHQIYIDDEFRGKGLAKKLMDCAEEYFREKNIKRIKLTVTLENVSAIKLYEKIGYQKKRVVMEKNI
ncbi:MAG: GNAT family N-acetyltransferase [Candidatus Aenigmarchaeota archaeon]|nr:GNAT family N-acetyltransferase [Candidatus Aenigmarchaeota archaeon]